MRETIAHRPKSAAEIEIDLQFMRRLYSESKMLERAVSLLICADEEIPYYTGYIFEGINITRKDGKWLLVLRATRSGREPVVTFVGASRVHECLWLLDQQLRHRTVRWSVDKFR